MTDYRVTGIMGDDDEAIVAVDQYEAGIEAARDQYRLEFPCVCIVEYTGRGLVAPNCDHHDHHIADDIVAVFLAQYPEGVYALGCDKPSTVSGHHQRCYVPLKKNV